MIMKPNGIYPIEYGILGKQFDVKIKFHQDKVYHENKIKIFFFINVLVDRVSISHWNLVFSYEEITLKHFKFRITLIQLEFSHFN